MAQQRHRAAPCIELTAEIRMREHDDLVHLKALLIRKYLGTAGIYGIGISRGGSSFKIFVDPRPSDELELILAAVRTDAAPFTVLVVSTDQASAREID